MPKLVDGKNVGGRPQVEIDLVKVQELAALNASDTDIAIQLGVSRNSIKRVKKRKDYQDAIARGRVNTRMRIRSKVLELVDAGHPTMVIWADKTICGTSEEGNNSDPISEITLRVKRPPRPGP
jgi:hypothetical protein